MICTVRRHQKIVLEMEDAAGKRQGCRLARNLARCNSAASATKGSSKSRTLDCALARAGVSEARRVRSAGPTSFLSLRRSSALPAVPRHANIDCRPPALMSLLTQWFPGPVGPFSESCRQLVFSIFLFSPLLSSRATKRRR